MLFNSLLQQSEALHQQLQQTALEMNQIVSAPEPEAVVVAPVVQTTVPAPAKPIRQEKLSKVEQSFMALPKGHYSLQVLGARYEATAKQFLASLGSLNSPIYVLELERGGEPWFVVLVGDFGNQGDARKAISDLPQKVRNLQPWARPVTKLQQQLVNKINAGGE